MTDEFVMEFRLNAIELHVLCRGMITLAETGQTLTTFETNALRELIDRFEPAS